MNDITPKNAEEARAKMLETLPEKEQAGAEENTDPRAISSENWDSYGSEYGAQTPDEWEQEENRKKNSAENKG